MSPLIDSVLAIAARHTSKSPQGISKDSAVDQDLYIQGDDAEKFVAELTDMFGVWVCDWPWQQFVNFNEPPASLGPRIWKFLRLSSPARAFPGYTEARLELRHIAAVIEKGEWFDP